MRNLREYHRPEMLAEALHLPGRKDSCALVPAGGTQFTAQAPPDVESVVDLEFLSYIESDDEGLRTGATTSLAELVNSPVARAFAAGVLVLAPVSCTAFCTLTVQLWRPSSCRHMGAGAAIPCCSTRPCSEN